MRKWNAKGNLIELNGYAWGEHVEYKYRDEWLPGVITEFDVEDEQAPYYVASNGEWGDGWQTPEDVRKVAAPKVEADAVRQLQYRISRMSGAEQGSDAGTWQNIEVGASSVTALSISIPPCAHYQRIQLRQTLPHTDEEILAELRKLDRRTLNVRVSNILDGKF